MQQLSSKPDYSAPLEPEQSVLSDRRPPRSLVWSYRLLWLTFFIFFASTGAGKLWDRYWHATHRFDNFWSPPHFFVFIMTMITGLLVATIAFTPRLNACFGPSIRMPVLRMKVAGPLVILGGGLVALTITIMLDNFWHSAFGLDETQWSVPHAMLGWSWFTIIMGFVAARIAFRAYRPINWLTTLIISLLFLEFVCPAILGPFYLNYSPHLVQALKNIPIVRTEPSAQHMYHIYLQFSLTRQTSPLYIPQVAFFAGLAMAFLRALEKRARIYLLAPFLWSLLLMGRDLYTLYFLHYRGIVHVNQILPVALQEPSLWLPIPLFAAVLTFTLLHRTSFTETRCYLLSGIVFGVCTFGIWHDTPWKVLLALPAALTVLGGSYVGKWLYRLMEKPTLEDLMRFLLITCAQIPALLGVVDLFLRRSTPFP
ncbi:hypothetical protein [Tengunoibacter tsumagoiensis]|uniref:Uncharacterized protein n=1 Tax=Tengunoibacter tsumagoiensis TaxID=2014871 RepID=A0A402A0N3_9CHLR|nr:hypothetical protein [Tengunoibacter tsumagoiensis]GCE12616.1 hypothetical protein KTT_24750 [Tengunoibacter tsumagoiensis]